MVTTIKIKNETKEKLKKLDLAEKGKSFDMLVNDLITFYQQMNKKYKKNSKVWEKSFKEYQRKVRVHEQQMEDYNKDMKKYKKEQIVWDKLLKWAKSKGFKL